MDDIRSIFETANASNDAADWRKIYTWIERQGHIEVPGLSIHVGDTVYVRCVTYHHIGVVRSMTRVSMELYPAVWVAYSGSLAEALAAGLSPDEAEWVVWRDSVYVMYSAIVDWSPWRAPLPRKSSGPLGAEAMGEIDLFEIPPEAYEQE